MGFKQLTECRCCKSKSLIEYLDYGQMPLANNLEDTQEQAINAKRYPMKLLFCEDCGLSQLSIVINPDILFKNYTYRSAMSQTYKNHCLEMAKHLTMPYHGFHIDIAGNDGTLLKEFRKVHPEMKRLNIDPAINLCKYSLEDGISCHNDYWNSEKAKKITEFYGKADLITATNVLAHVHEVSDFLKGIEIALADDGIFVLEFPYIVNFINNNEFDTVYFEHLSYLSISVLEELCGQNNLSIKDISFQAIHGGTVRVTIKKSDSLRGFDPLVLARLQIEIEDGYLDLPIYEKFALRARVMQRDLLLRIIELKQEGKKIVAFGASAKGNTLLNFSRLNHTYIDAIIDETPEKIGKYSPGTGIPIVGMDYLKENEVDYIIILAWNFKKEIMEKLYNKTNAKFIIPIPKFEVV